MPEGIGGDNKFSSHENDPAREIRKNRTDDSKGDKVKKPFHLQEAEEKRIEQQNAQNKDGGKIQDKSSDTRNFGNNGEKSQYGYDWGIIQVAGLLRMSKGDVTQKLGLEPTSETTQKLKQESETTQKLEDHDSKADRITPLTPEINQKIEAIAEVQKHNKSKFEDLSPADQEKIVRTRVLNSKSKLWL